MHIIQDSGGSFHKKAGVLIDLKSALLLQLQDGQLERIGVVSRRDTGFPAPGAVNTESMNPTPVGLARKPPMNCAKMSYVTMSRDDESDNSLLTKFPGLKVWPNAVQGFVR
jgi:hypothetical protein